MTTVKFDRRVPAGVRAQVEAHADKVCEVLVGDAGDDYRYMAYLRSGWCKSDDLVHTLFGSTGRELIRELRAATPCDCEDCRG